MYFHTKSKAVIVVSVLTFVTGVFVASGWLLTMPRIESLFERYFYLKFNTAVCFILTGSALAITQVNQKKYSKLLFITFAAALTLIAGLTLLQYLFNFNAGIDQIFVADRLAVIRKNPFPGRMLSQTALIFTLFGLAFLCFCSKNHIVDALSQYILHLITAYSGIAVIGYIYSFSFLQSLQSQSPIIFLVACLFFLTSISASLLQPSLGITRLFTGRLVGNKMARRLFVTIAFVIIIFGALKGQSMGFKLFWFDTSFSILTFCLVMMSLAIIWHTANWLNKLDLKRYEAEEEIKVMNENLEKRVEERTADLLNLLEKFQESETKFRTLAEKSMVGIYISHNDRFIYVNPRFAEIFGYEQDELTDTSDSALNLVIGDEDRPTVRKIVQARYAGQADAVNYEVTGKKKDGTANRIAFYGNLVTMDGKPCMMGTALDVTERSTAEEILKRSEANLRTIMDSTDTAYALLDKDFNVMVFNQLAVKFVNNQFDEFPSPQDNLEEFFPKEKFARFTSYANEVLKGNTVSYEVNYPQPGAPGFWYHVRLFPIKNEDNEILGLLLELSDITERKVAENNLIAAYDQIQAHINSIQDMAWKQSHLIRGPLANLKGLVAMMKEDPLDNEILNYIAAELERLDKVIIEMAEDVANDGQKKPAG